MEAAEAVVELAAAGLAEVELVEVDEAGEEQAAVMEAATGLVEEAPGAERVAAVVVAARVVEELEEVVEVEADRDVGRVDLAMAEAVLAVATEVAEEEEVAAVAAGVLGAGRAGCCRARPHPLR